MSAARLRGLASALAIVLPAALASGCVVADGGYAPGYGVGYYEPYSVSYGGWGPDYYVAPFRGGGHFAAGGHGGPHFFRSAPNGRTIPTIPSAPRGGGGFRGGGGGGARGR